MTCTPARAGGARHALSIDKACPICSGFFKQRPDGRPRTCSRSCARRRDAQVYGPRNWKGGVTKHPSGYIKEQSKGHPLADTAGYVMQHRLVMEKVLGRFLLAAERIHHKNGIRDDNRPENLELWLVNGANGKDPAGQRMTDLARHIWASLTPEDRVLLHNEFTPKD